MPAWGGESGVGSVVKRPVGRASAQEGRAGVDVLLGGNRLVCVLLGGIQEALPCTTAAFQHEGIMCGFIDQQVKCSSSTHHHPSEVQSEVFVL